MSFLHPSTLGPLFRDVPFRHGITDVAEMDLARAVGGAMRQQGAQTLVFIDVLCVLHSPTAGGGRALAALAPAAGARLLGLDLWGLPESDMVWDISEHRRPIDPMALDIPSLRPSPMVRPTAPGAYRALPEMPILDAGTRAAARREAGVGPDERMLLVATGRWQLPTTYYQHVPRLLATHFPEIFEMVLRRLDPRTRMIHVGPKSFDWGQDHPRYAHLAQLAPADFRRLIAAADAFLTVNVSATSLAAAIAAGTPSVVLRNSSAGASVAEVEARTGPLAADVRAWVERVLPLHPFRVCPLGLHSFLTPILAGNPYVGAFDEAEVLEIDAAAALVQELMTDEGRRERARQGQRELVAQVAVLPSALDRFRQLADD